MNDSQRWTDWIASHGPQLVLFARRWAVDHADAEDLVQEAFVRFWPARSGVNDPLAYLYRCVRTVAIDAARSRFARDGRELAVSATRDESPQLDCELENDERRQQIEAALAELPLEQAEVVTLKIWSNLTFAQIAEVTCASPGTVASRYRYAMEHLRRLLSESNTP